MYDCYGEENAASADLLRTLHLSSQAEQQLVRDWVHKIEESSIFVQDVVEWRAFQTQILPNKKQKQKLEESQLRQEEVVNNIAKIIMINNWKQWNLGSEE